MSQMGEGWGKGSGKGNQMQICLLCLLRKDMDDDNNDDNGDGDYDNSDDDVAADADTANKDKMMCSVCFTLVFATDTGISLRALYRKRTSCSAEHEWHALQHAAHRVYLRIPADAEGDGMDDRI